MSYKNYIICPFCKGTGVETDLYGDDDTCFRCDGKGEILEGEYEDSLLNDEEEK